MLSGRSLGAARALRRQCMALPIKQLPAAGSGCKWGAGGELDKASGYSTQREEAAEGSSKRAELSVSGATSAWRLGHKLSSILGLEGKCELLASGNEAVNRLMQGAAVARDTIVRRGPGDLQIRPGHLFRLHRHTADKMIFQVERCRDTLRLQSPGVVKIDVKESADTRILAGEISESISSSDALKLVAVGSRAVANAVVALAAARRHLLERKRDILCHPSLTRLEPPKAGFPHGICMTVVGSQSDEEAGSVAPRSARFPLRADELPTYRGLLAGVDDLDWPTVKVGSKTDPSGAAAALVSRLQSEGRVQVMCTGTSANCRAAKSLALCRRLVREVPGYDVACQVRHAPPGGRDGSCKLVVSAELVKDAAESVAALESEKISFRIGTTNDPLLSGRSIALQLEHCSMVDCTSSGEDSISRSLVAVSHARLLLSEKNLGLAAFPRLSGGREGERLTMDILAFPSETLPKESS